mgnify:CR=1 FL=1
MGDAGHRQVEEQCLRLRRGKSRYGRAIQGDLRRAQQAQYLDEIRDRFDAPLMLAPLRQDEPIGLDELRAFGGAISGLAEIAETERSEVTLS